MKRRREISLKRKMIDSKRQILVLLPYKYDTAPGQRYRWEQWIPILEARGLVARRLHFETDSISIARAANRGLAAVVLSTWRYFTYMIELLSELRKASLVVVHRNAAPAGPPLVEALLFARGTRVVYDFDDAIYMPPSGETRFFRRLFRCDWRVAYICGRARHVGVGNSELASFARSVRSASVGVWPSSIDCERSGPSLTPNRRLTIGWTGSSSTSRYLPIVLPALRELQENYDFDVLIVGTTVDLQSWGIRGRCAPWTPESEVPLLQQMSIGLMPLEDTPWERGKCSLKALAYQSAGIPAVVSDVGMNREAVIDGVTGFLVPAGGDWRAPLISLIEDPELRCRMGAAGRRHVEERYSATVVAAKVFADLAAIAAKAPVVGG